MGKLKLITLMFLGLFLVWGLVNEYVNYLNPLQEEKHTIHDCVREYKNFSSEEFNQCKQNI